MAQVAIVLVAIFGYFYTVQPVYQKERLAEQVAEYDGIIKKQGPRVAELESRIAALQSERQQLAGKLQKEREQLSTELRSIRRELALARAEKKEIEQQIQYMTFKYRLPDGRPATTPEQVRIAQEAQLRASFFSELSTCHMYATVFPYFGGDADDKSKYFPFSEKEVNAWREIGTKLPLTQAMACVERTATQYTKTYGNHYSPGLIPGFRTEAMQRANTAPSKTWAPPADPLVLIEELARKRAAVEVERTAALKKNEEQYGNWKSVSDEQRRVVVKHNYDIMRRSAEANAAVALIGVRYEYQVKAREFRKSVGDEIKRLTSGESQSATRIVPNS